ncbi:inositol-3-phosphate synthase [Naumannella huperziae]
MSIRLAIAGVGNCANALIQGLSYYADARDEDFVPGLMHTRLGPWRVRDIELVAAFDVVQGKVGADAAEAIWASPNDTLRFAEVPPLGVEVLRGPTLDGLGHYYQGTVEEARGESVDVARVLRETGADVLISYLPVGSEEATKSYAEAALDAGVAFINAIPVFIASDPAWANRFREAGVPIIGDDIKSQLGATITHRVLARLFETRGIRIDRTYQLNVGGNMDFKNMLERERLESKKLSKTRAVTSNIDIDLPADDVHVGPSDHVPWLTDRKFAFVRLEGRGFGNAPVSLEYKLEVWDSPNSAGIVIDAVRLAKLARDAGLGGPIDAAASAFMKSPPIQLPDDVAHDQLEKFIASAS